MSTDVWEVIFKYYLDVFQASKHCFGICLITRENINKLGLVGKT